LIKGADSVVFPAADGAVFESTRRLAVAEIIKSDKALTAAAAEFFKRYCLGTSHVGFEASEEHHPRRFPDDPVVGDGTAVIPC